MIELQEFKSPCFKHIKVSFCKRANEAKQQQMCAKGHLRPLSRI